MKGHRRPGTTGAIVSSLVLYLFLTQQLYHILRKSTGLVRKVHLVKHLLFRLPPVWVST